MATEREQELANLQAYIDDPNAVDAGYKAIVISCIWNVNIIFH